MSTTARLGLPLVQAAQAQKHVTVNEALVLIDGAAGLSLKSADNIVPPALANDGDTHGVAVGATGDWLGHDSEIAIRSNGGWVYLVPQKGWHGWIADRETAAVFDGSGWIDGAVAISQNNAATVHEIIEIDHTVAVGASSTVSAAIPAHSMVIGVTGRVISTISGSLSDWKLGISGFDDRYGSGLGLALGSWVRGLTSTPQTYYSDTDLLLSANGGDFATGQFRIAVHLMRLKIPSV